MEKLRMAELKAEAEFMEKRQSAGFKAQKLKIEEQYAKEQARMRILENLQNSEVLQLPGEYDKKNLLLGWVHHTSLKI